MRFLMVIFGILFCSTIARADFVPKADCASFMNETAGLDHVAEEILKQAMTARVLAVQAMLERDIATKYADVSRIPADKRMRSETAERLSEMGDELTAIAKYRFKPLVDRRKASAKLYCE